MLTPDDRTLLAALAEAEEKATKGPWFSLRSKRVVYSDAEQPYPGRPMHVCTEREGWSPLENFEFIALARNAIPRLLAIIAEQEAEIERLAGQLLKYETPDNETLRRWAAECVPPVLPPECPRCHGNGRIEMLEHCPECGGKGTIAEETDHAG